jgi:hypothetical protein
LEEDVPQRVAPAVFGTPQRREFPGEQTVRFLLRQYSKYAEHHMYSSISHFSVVMVRVATLLINLNKNPPNLLTVFYFLHSKIEYRRSKNCSAGNPPPRGNLGLKCTRMYAILK